MGQKVSKDFESLLESAAAGDPVKLKAAIEAGADVNKAVEKLKDEKHIKKAALKCIYAGDTPLLVAVRNSGSIECVRLLIDAGADVNKVSAGHITTLCVAITKNNIECLKILIEAGADVNIMRPLCVAVEHNNIDCAKMLIEAGADVNKGNTRYGTPMYTAVSQNGIAYVKLLIEAGADVNSKCLVKVKEGRSKSRYIITVPLHAAINYGNVECLKIILDARANVNLFELYASDLHLWFKIQPSLDTKIRCLQLILSKGALVNQPGKFWSSALESFLSFLGENESAIKGVKLIMAAGEKGGSLVQVKTSGLSLRIECREAIRRHLLSINNINLFIRVSQLPLPEILQSYLLYDVTLDEDYVTNDIIDDIDFLCEIFVMRRFESIMLD